LTTASGGQRSCYATGDCQSYNQPTWAVSLPCTLLPSTPVFAIYY